MSTHASHCMCAECALNVRRIDHVPIGESVRAPERVEFNLAALEGYPGLTARPGNIEAANAALLAARSKHVDELPELAAELEHPAEHPADKHDKPKKK